MTHTAAGSAADLRGSGPNACREQTENSTAASNAETPRGGEQRHSQGRTMRGTQSSAATMKNYEEESRRDGKSHEDVVESLYETLLNRRACLLIGAGVSVSVAADKECKRLVTWKGFLRALAKLVMERLHLDPSWYEQIENMLSTVKSNEVENLGNTSQKGAKPTSDFLAQTYQSQAANASESDAMDKCLENICEANDNDTNNNNNDSNAASNNNNNNNNNGKNSMPYCNHASCANCRRKLLGAGNNSVALDKAAEMIEHYINTGQNGGSSDPFMRYHHLVFKILHTLRANKDAPLAVALDRLNAPIFTTNYDVLLEDATERFTLSIDDLLKSQRMYRLKPEIHPLQQHQQYVFHLHGVYYDDPERKFVLTTREYAVTIDDFIMALKPVLIDIGSRDMTGGKAFHRSLVFIGTGGTLQDVHFASLFSSLYEHNTYLESNGFSRIYHYVLVSEKEKELVTHFCFEDSLGQQIHSTELLIPVVYGKDYDDLPPFLLQLADRLEQDDPMIASIRSARLNQTSSIHKHDNIGNINQRGSTTSLNGNYQTNMSRTSSTDQNYTDGQNNGQQNHQQRPNPQHQRQNSHTNYQNVFPPMRKQSSFSGVESLNSSIYSANHQNNYHHNNVNVTGNLNPINPDILSDLAQGSTSSNESVYGGSGAASSKAVRTQEIIYNNDAIQTDIPASDSNGDLSSIKSQRRWSPLPSLEQSLNMDSERGMATEASEEGIQMIHNQSSVLDNPNLVHLLPDRSQNSTPLKISSNLIDNDSGVGSDNPHVSNLTNNMKTIDINSTTNQLIGHPVDPLDRSISPTTESIDLVTANTVSSTSDVLDGPHVVSLEQQYQNEMHRYHLHQQQQHQSQHNQQQKHIPYDPHNNHYFHHRSDQHDHRSCDVVGGYCTKCGGTGIGSACGVSGPSSPRVSSINTNLNHMNNSGILSGGSSGGNSTPTAAIPINKNSGENYYQDGSGQYHNISSSAASSPRGNDAPSMNGVQESPTTSGNFAMGHSGTMGSSASLPMMLRTPTPTSTKHYLFIDKNHMAARGNGHQAGNHANQTERSHGRTGSGSWTTR